MEKELAAPQSSQEGGGGGVQGAALSAPLPSGDRV